MKLSPGLRSLLAIPSPATLPCLDLPAPDDATVVRTVWSAHFDDSERFLLQLI